ncbi:hypothetical protein [uncultured Williamsia sp.]|uniref:hypothetical protein n=1 Tax=uncultured Williamsia sp. TaxID=259311 RepID=UPI00261FE3F1|nr:hypothetical protein [uncultured Williamsia sp.]
MPQLPNSIEPNWTPGPKVAQWAKKHGFGDPVPATDSDFRAFSKAHGGAAPGLYLWGDSEHRIYIGIATQHVVKRMRSHVKEFLPVSNIQNFRYRPMAKTSAELREVERKLVHKAVEDSSNFVVMNREHAAVIVGDSVLDDVMSQADQAAWLEDPISTWRSSSSSQAVDRAAAAEKAWRKFEKRSDKADIVEAVALYARLCIPYAPQTVYDWWVITCPGWKNKDFERVCTVNMAFLELLWFVEDRKSGKLTVSVGTDKNFLPTLWSTVQLRMFPIGQQHQSGGSYEEVIQFASIADFKDALTRSGALRRGAARFALNRMRRGKVGGRYMSSHSPQLANAVLDRANELNVKPVEEKSLKTRLPKGWFKNFFR